jgi:hypothetical protein
MWKQAKKKVEHKRWMAQIKSYRFGCIGRRLGESYSKLPSYCESSDHVMPLCRDFGREKG